MSATEYYNHSTFPVTNSAGSSAGMRSELEAIETGFGKLPDLSGNGAKVVVVNAGGTALEAVAASGLTVGVASAVAVGGITGLGTGVGTFLATPSSVNLAAAVTGETGTGALVFATSPTLITPNIGVATATSINLTKIGQLNALVNITLGDGNCPSVTTGAGHVAVGYAALNSVVTGNFNTGVGTFAGRYSTGSNNIFLGADAQGTLPASSNEVTLGDSAITTLRCQVTSITALSDARDKTDVTPLPAGLATVMALNPVRFTWNMRDGGKVGIKSSGFIAQELQAVDDEWLRLVYAENPDKLEATYGNLIPVLVKAIQELKQEFDQYRSNHP